MTTSKTLYWVKYCNKFEDTLEGYVLADSVSQIEEKLKYIKEIKMVEDVIQL